MDVNMFYRHLFDEVLGLDALGLTNTERDLVRLIDTYTLTAFSNYVPARYRIHLNPNDRTKIIRKENWVEGAEYYIDDPMLDKFNLEILSLEKIEPENKNMDPFDPSSSAYYNSIIASRNNITLESVLMGSEYTYNRTLIDSSIPYKRYQELRGGRVVYLQNWAMECDLILTVHIRWPNIRSIAQEYSEAFTTLAMYDCRRVLWHSLRNIEDIPTPTGNMQLRFDWSDTEDRRNDFIRELNGRSLPDRVINGYFTIL